MNAGFTLIEMILYTFFLAILLIVLLNAFTSILSSQAQSEATSAVIADGRFIFSRLAYDITRSDSILTPVSVGNSTTTLVISVGGQNFTYASDGNGNFTLTNASGTDMITSFGSVISNLSFQRLGQTGGKNSIKVNFRLTSTTRSSSGFEAKDFTTTLGTR